MPRPTRRIAVLSVLFATLSVTWTAWARPNLGANDVPTLFYIAKSDDRNRVDYGVRLDARCVPVGGSPIYAYWRRFEPGQEPLGDLNMLDRRAYGVTNQRVVSRTPGDARVEFGVRALADRRLTARVARNEATGACEGEVLGSVGGQTTVLRHVFVQLDGPMRVRHVDLAGGAPGEAEVTERIEQ